MRLIPICIMFTYIFFCFLSEADEIYKICSILGTPNKNIWAEGLQLADGISYQFPQVTCC